MTYQLPYTGNQLRQSVAYAIEPSIFSLKSNNDLAMPQSIASINTYQDVVFTGVDQLITGNFSYDGQIVTYTGTEDIKVALNLSCSLDSNVINNTLHIGQEINGVIDTGAESSAKVESVTGIVSLNIATIFELTTGDEINLAIKADKVSTLGIYHFQVVISQLVIS